MSVGAFINHQSGLEDDGHGRDIGVDRSQQLQEWKKHPHNEIDLLIPELTLHAILYAIVVEFLLQILW